MIVDYGVGNLGSIANMLRKAGVACAISSDLGAIEAADKLVLPGVGAFDNGMRNLAERGLTQLLNAQVLKHKKPVLGLCLGMQLFGRRSEEGALAGLNWLDFETIRFKLDGVNARLKIPHMGWNTLQMRRRHALLDNLGSDARFYFVHSYHVVCADQEDVMAETNYGYDFPSVVGRDNLFGAQFHPEKSHKFGMTLLRNFAERI